jgi:flagellar hook-associated protein 2
MSSVSSSSSSSSGLSQPVTISTGFNSGLPIDDIVTQLIAVEQKPITLLQQKEDKIKLQQTSYTQVQTYMQTLLTSIKALTNRDVATGATIFDNMTTTSSKTDIATATASNTAASQNITLEVKKLPSLTTATSTAGVGAFNNSTTIEQLGITPGFFTMYANGSPYTVNVVAGETMGDIMNTMHANAPSGISADPTIVDGKISITYDPGAQIALGTGGDTSNFLAITNLLTGVNDTTTNTITASQRNSTLDRNKVLSSAAANLATPLVDGTFLINGVTFDTTGKTMNDMIDAINTSSANVTASYNKGNNTFQLASKNTGSSYISMSDQGGNFLTAMKLISPGNTTASQTLGQNAQFVLNGQTMYSATTTVDETVSGLTGVTLNLVSASPGTTVNISVKSDTNAIVDAVKTAVNNYNTAIAYIDKQTDAQNKMPLAGQSGIINLRNQIRSMFTSQIGALAGNNYDSLQQIGISTGAVGSSAGKATAQLTFDSTKLTAALADNATTVKKLFIAQDLGGAQNNTPQDNGFNGVFTQIKNLLSDQTYTDSNGNTAYGALYLGTSDSNRGLFSAYKTSSDKQIALIDKSISDMQARLEKKKTDLRNRFLAMDKLVGQYQSQSSALTGLINQLNKSNSS